MKAGIIRHLIRIPTVVCIALAIFLTVVTSFKAKNVDAADLETTIKPGDDFYRYANGGWLKHTNVPDGSPSFDMRTVLRKKTSDRVRAIITEAAAVPEARGSLRQKVGDYFASVMDKESIEAKGVAPLQPDLARIDAIADKSALSAYLGSTLNTETDGLVANADHVFGLWVAQSFHDSKRNVPHLWQGGLGLPDRESYLDGTEKGGEARAAYQHKIAGVFRATGFSEPERRAAEVLALEVKLAGTHAPDADAADTFKQDNPWKMSAFAAQAPGMDWPAYFKAAGLAEQREIIVWQPSAVIGTAALVRSEPIATWKDYLCFHLIEQYALVLPTSLRVEEMPDRETAAIAATVGAVGHAVGQLYVQKHFSPAAKAKAEGMVKDLITAYRQRIAANAWMSPRTKTMALAKLATLKIGVGYPDQWADYRSLKIVRGDAFGNMQRAVHFQRQRNLEQLARPADPGEWRIQAESFGAIILVSPNAEFFSAGLLQVPFFDPDADAASNYGSAGAGMAHEITHILDELGNIYDEQGRLTHWWRDADVAAYQGAVAKLAAQMAKNCPFTDACVNGKQVLGETSADLAGLLVAHDAYILSLQGKPDIVVNGLSGEQRFFLAFAQRWRTIQTEKALRAQIAGDTHAPGEYRSDLVRNVDAWYDAFGVAPGDKLYLAPEERVRVW